MNEAIAYGNAIAAEKAQSDRQLIVDSRRTEILTLTDEQRQEWVDAMKPVWKKFESKVGKDMIEAAIASNK